MSKCALSWDNASLCLRDFIAHRDFFFFFFYAKLIFNSKNLVANCISTHVCIIREIKWKWDSREANINIRPSCARAANPENEKNASLKPLPTPRETIKPSGIYYYIGKGKVTPCIVPLARYIAYIYIACSAADSWIESRASIDRLVNNFSAPHCYILYTRWCTPHTFTCNVLYVYKHMG